MSVTPVKPEEVMVISETDDEPGAEEFVNGDEVTQSSPVMIAAQANQVNEEQEHPDIYMDLLKEIHKVCPPRSE